MGWLDWMRRKQVDAIPEHDEMRGRIVLCERCDYKRWNQHVIAKCLVEGLQSKFPDIRRCGGLVQVRVTEQTRIERLRDGQKVSAALDELRSGSQVEIGSFVGVEQGDPVAIYPESLLLLS